MKTRSVTMVAVLAAALALMGCKKDEKGGDKGGDDKAGGDKAGAKKAGDTKKGGDKSAKAGLADLEVVVSAVRRAITARRR